MLVHKGEGASTYSPISLVIMVVKFDCISPLKSKRLRFNKSVLPL